MTRRSLLTWLGNSTVLLLGADLWIACEDGESPGPRRGGAGAALAGGHAAGGGAPGGSGGAGGTATQPTLPFEPGATSDPIYSTFRINTVDPPDLKAILAAWSLTIDGLVEESATLGFADLLSLPSQDQVTDFHCVEGWSVYDVPWRGVHLDTLAALVRPLPEATHVTFHCVGGVYRESLPLTVAREPHTLVAYGVAGTTLPLSHGFPLRLVVPRLFGYKNAKYVERVEFTDAPVNGYWEPWGYSYAAEVPSSRLREGKT